MQSKDLHTQIHVEDNTDSNMLTRCTEWTGIYFIISKRVSVSLWSMQSLGLCKEVTMMYVCDVDPGLVHFIFNIELST
jgi:hypothetical protein